MRLILAVLLILLATTAQAYIGPGAGIPVLGSLIGIIVTIVVAIGAILFWPIRKMLKRGKNKTATADNTSDNAAASAANSDANPEEIVDAVINDPNENK